MNNPPAMHNFPTFLFIGGTRDGARLPVDPRVAVVELHLPGSRTGRKGAPAPTEIYARMQFVGETETFHLFALKGISGNSALKALIENYPQPEK